MFLKERFLFVFLAINKGQKVVILMVVILTEFDFMEVILKECYDQGHEGSRDNWFLKWNTVTKCLKVR